MNTPYFRTTTVSVGTALGLLSSAFAIERPGEGKTEVLPAEVVPPQALDLVQQGKQDKVAWLGVMTEALSEDLAWHLKLNSGVIVRVVDPNSPAGEAGIKDRDIILTVAEKPVATRAAVKALIQTQKPGAEVGVKVLRQGREMEVKVTLGERDFVAPSPMVQRGDERIPGFAQRVFPGKLDPEDQEALRRQLMARVQEALKGEGLDDMPQGGRLKLNLNDLLQGGLPDADFNLGLKSSGSVSFSDQNGSVTMRTVDGKKEVKVTDPSGKVLFEGPYNTEVDKEAVPEEYRERIESLGMTGGGMKTFKFDLTPGGEDLPKPEPEPKKKD